MTDLKVIYRTRSKSAADAVRRVLRRHDIQVVATPGLLGKLFPGNRFDDIALAIAATDETKAREVLDSRKEEISEHVSRVRDDYKVLEARMSYEFRDRTILEHALTHRSKAREDDVGGVEDNESLEFLGDAVLGLIIADRLYRECPQYDEGQKSKLKAQLVSAATLAEIGTGLRLGEHLLLGRGELKSGGKRKPSLLANTVEAVIAAVYLDGGYDAATAFILHLFSAEFSRLRRGGAAVIGNDDFKSSLQEWLQAQNRPLPDYHLAKSSGPDHDKLFTIELRVDRDVLAVGEGRSKKDAEQKAAKRALATLRNTK